MLGEFELPQRNVPKHAFVRVRVPDGWKVVEAESAGKKSSVDEKGTVDVSGIKGKVAMEFKVAKR